MDQTNGIGGHDLFALERFQEDTRHMIICDIRINGLTFGGNGDCVRLFLSDEGYANAKTAESRGHIKIKRHAAVIEGYIVPDKKKKRRGH